MGVKLVIHISLGLIFLAFGVIMLMTAYVQNHPVTFLALFFSSSLIILLSAACLVGVVWRALSPGDKVRAESSEIEEGNHQSD